MSTLVRQLFFNAISSYSDNCPDGCTITLSKKISESLTVEQISQTPTMIELFFGLLKKYLNELYLVNAYIQDIDDLTYLTWMHPKALLK